MVMLAPIDRGNRDDGTGKIRRKPMNRPASLPEMDRQPEHIGIRDRGKERPA